MGDIRDVERRERRFERRMGRRLAIGAVLGALVGAVLGLTVGLVAFDAWTRGMWAMAIAGAIFGGGVAAVVAGVSGLGSPPPGREPLQVDRPVRDAAEPTVEYGDGRREEAG